MMKLEATLTTAAIGAALVLSAPASAGYNVTQTAAPAPAYSTLINFESAPAGANPSNTYSGLGLSMYSGVDPSGFGVADGNGIWPWLPASNGNVAAGNFGLFLDFAPGATSVSFQAWGDAGAPSMFGGGIWVWVLDGQGNVISNADVFTPAWGGIGNTWYNVTTTGGSTIEHLLISNNSNIGSETIIDNLSWTPAPAPGAFALLGVAGLVGGRRRRR